MSFFEKSHLYKPDLLILTHIDNLGENFSVEWTPHWSKRVRVGAQL